MVMNLTLNPKYVIALFDKQDTFIGWQSHIGRTLGHPHPVEDPNCANQFRDVQAINEELEYMSTHKEFDEVTWVVYEINSKLTKI